MDEYEGLGIIILVVIIGSILGFTAFIGLFIYLLIRVFRRGRRLENDDLYTRARRDRAWVNTANPSNRPQRTRAGVIQKRLTRPIEEPSVQTDWNVELHTPLSIFEAQASIICPVCQTSFSSGEQIRTCPECSVQHHKECWSMIGGCSTFGCKYTPTS